ncbi:MAG: hypothetical protein LBS82_01220, partial [Spirochaetaceae bacterium]|nr:hypothetical protein [Spirochaetaceae bacterium]
TNHEIFADFRRLGAQTHDKGVHHAAEARTWILPLDAPAPKSAKTPGGESYESTASPWRRVFDAEHIGKRLHIMMRWENRSLDGDEDAGKGPWSAVQSIIIP